MIINILKFKTYYHQNSIKKTNNRQNIIIIKFANRYQKKEFIAGIRTRNPSEGPVVHITSPQTSSLVI